MKNPADDPTAWFAKGDKDCQLAELAIQSEEDLAELACYHEQQCAEKYLKGFLVARQVPFRFVHDLDYLVNQCVEQDDEFENLHEAATALQAYATQSRHPGEEEVEVTLEEAKTALANAQTIRNFVQQRLATES